MGAFTTEQQHLLVNLVGEAVEVARRKGKMTEADALLGLQLTVAGVAEAIVGSKPAATSLRDIADEIELRGRQPVRLPKKNELEG